MNGFGAEEPMVSGAAWRDGARLVRPAASHAHHYFITHLPTQLYAIILILLVYTF